MNRLEFARVMRRWLLGLLGAAVVVVLATTARVDAQDFTPQRMRDTLEPLADWVYEDMVLEAVMSLRWRTWYMENPMRRSELLSYPDTRTATPQAESRHEKIRLLSWKVTVVVFDSVRVDEALLWIEYKDSLLRRRWALAELSRYRDIEKMPSPRFPGGWPHFGWELSTGTYCAKYGGFGDIQLPMVADSNGFILMNPTTREQWKRNPRQEHERPRVWPLMTFDHPPTNADVYAFLTGWMKGTCQSTEARFLAFDPESLLDSSGDTRFIDGDVRERTWRLVIGEPPTRFFPGGK